ncbi:hypothetical protein [Spongiimicrobium salis]|uniref:hypothetical protein n=1 Tax=Spongiimicrobium salis TaxID=1667022 RepID=UPI00374DDC0E
MRYHFSLKRFVIVTLVTSIWINVSEVVRYFVFVAPRTKAFFKGRPNIAQIDPFILGVWTFWDMLLSVLVVGSFWLFINVYGNTKRSILYSASFIWALLFVLFWIATINMGLASWDMLWIVLPLSWVEMLVANYFASILYQKHLHPNI